MYVEFQLSFATQADKKLMWATAQLETNETTATDSLRLSRCLLHIHNYHWALTRSFTNV